MDKHAGLGGQVGEFGDAELMAMRAVLESSTPQFEGKKYAGRCWRPEKSDCFTGIEDSDKGGHRCGLPR